MTQHPVLAAVIALASVTHLMFFWMYATRLPAMRAVGMSPDPQAPRGEQMARLPASVRWKADNYNHLMEQPTVFYAVALSLAVLGDEGGWSAGLAWAYVGLRVAHSLVQALINRIEVRFALFFLSGLVLVALTVRAGLGLVG